MKKIPKALQANFDDLFSSKENAVILYLSLERRYNHLKRHIDSVGNPSHCSKCQSLKVVSVADWFKCKADEHGASTQTELYKNCILTTDET